MKRTIMLMAILIISAVAAIASDGPGTMIQSASLYQYDAQQPLDEKVVLKEKRANLSIYHIDYLSTNGLRVTALFYVTKAGKRPLPCIMFLHGAGGSKDDFVIAYEMLASRGFAVFAIDTALHGERKILNFDEGNLDWYQLRNMFMQTVVDLRRGVDWLQTRPEVDPERIGFIGASQGTVIGVTFVGVEKRVKAAIFLVGAADFHVFLRNSALPSLVILRNYADTAQLDKVADELAAVDPQYYIGAISPRPVMIVNGRKDLIISVKSGQRLQDLANEPKSTSWYDGTHIPPIDKVLVKGAEFFRKNLGKGTPAEAKPAASEEKPIIKFNVARNHTDPMHRIATVTASTENPLPAGARLAIHFPHISPANLALFDDGTHGDKTAGDGVWTMQLDLGQAVPDLDVVGGNKLYTAIIRAVGKDEKVMSEADAGMLTVESGK